MRRQLVWAVVLALATFGIASAQETTSGSITAVVVDAQGAPVPGATVSITSNQGTKTFVTDSQGRFFAPFLTPGVHSVKVDLTGFSPVEQKNINVRLGQRLELGDLVLRVGGLEEVVEVVGTAPVIDTSSTTAGGVLDSDMINRLPVGRSLADTLYLVPGVSDSSGLGRANPSIAGGSGLENNYVVDGVNVTDVGFGGIGNFNPAFGSLGVGVTSDFVQETQVKTGGFEAEYGQATGGVVNVITKSGSNQFSGSAFGYFRPEQLEAEWKQLETPNGSVNTTAREEYDFGVSLGGPVMKDKLFFFGTFNPQFQNRSFIAPEGFPYRSLGSVKRERKIYSYAGKLTFQGGSNHRFDLSVFGDPSKGEAGLQRFATLRRISYPGAPGTNAIEGGFSELDYGGHNQTLRYDGIITRSWLIEASIGRTSNKFNEIPASEETQFTDLRQVPFGTTGGLGYHERTSGTNLQFTLKSTNIFNAGGNHQLRYGVQFEDQEFLRDVQYSGRPLPLADGQVPVTGSPIQIRTGGGVTFYRATRGKLLATAPVDQKYANFFIQDTWQIGRLTLRPGIRYERQKLTGIDPAGAAPDLCFEGDTRPGAGDGSGSAIPCTFTWDSLWAPRIGVTYDITGNGKSKLFASYGKFYAKIPNDLAARAMSADAGITRQDFRDAGLTQPVPNGESFGGLTTHLLQSSPHAAIIDPNADSTYKNELVGGVEFEVMRGVNLGARYVRRTMPSILEDLGELAVVGYFLDACGDAVVDYFITNINASSPTVTCGGAVPASFEDPAHTYQAFEVTMNKAFADNWGLIASYRYAKLEGNFEGFFRSDNGQTDPAISSLFDFPTNDATYAAIGVPQFGFGGDIRYQGCSLGCGVLPNDRPHQLKVYGNRTFGSLNLGVGFNYGSGTSLTALAGNPAYGNSGEVPEGIRGSGIQSVDGFRERSPDEVTLDLHADYSIRLNDRQRVILLADVFNLLNRQEPTNYDNYTETSTGVPNPNYGFATLGGGSSTASFQAPMSVRFGARFEW